MTTARLELSPPLSGDGRLPPRWAIRAAHLVPLLTLPSGLWRVPLAFGFWMGMMRDGRPVHVTGGESVYVVILSVVCETVALLSFGLVRPWGEVVPSWLPLVGGRRIPPLAVAVTAWSGAVALTAIWVFATVNVFAFGGDSFANRWWLALLLTCYLPLLLWGPLLAALATAYHRRRR